MTVYGTKGVIHRGGLAGYEPAVRAICEFFVERQAARRSEETIELFAFMEAADESKRRGGEPVAIADVMTSRTQVTTMRNCRSQKRRVAKCS